MDIKKLTEIYISALTENGLQSQITDLEDIRFSYEGRIHHLVFDNDDPLFITLMAASLCSVTSEEERYRILRICNQLAADHQFIKFFVGEHQVDGNFEQFRPPDPIGNSTFLTVCLRYLNRGIDELLENVEKMRGEQR